MTNHNDTIRLLNLIHNSSLLTLDTAQNIDEVMPNNPMKDDLMNISKEYGILNNIIRDEMSQYRANPVGVRMHEKALAKLSVKASLLKNNNQKALANMMMEASEHGIQDVYDAMMNCPNADQSVKTLAYNFIAMEQHHIDALSTYMNDADDFHDNDD